MFTTDSGAGATHILLALLRELEQQNPGFIQNVEARLNSAAKAAKTDPELADLQAAAAAVAGLTT